MTTPCTFTLGGTCCSSLSDITTFITNLKADPLFNNDKCCTDGSTVSSNCECAPKKDAAKTCIFDTCYDWPELYAMLNNVKAQYDHNNLAPLLIGGVTALWGFFGSQGDSVLKNAVPIFYSTTGGVVGIIAGVLSAIWIAKTTIDIGVKTSYTDATKGSTFKTYGGNSLAGDLLGFTETVYMVAFIILAAGTVGAPMELAFKMDQALAKADAVNSTQLQYSMLTYGLITAVGSFLGAVCINKSSELLLGFFDRQVTNASE